MLIALKLLVSIFHMQERLDVSLLLPIWSQGIDNLRLFSASGDDYHRIAIVQDVKGKACPILWEPVSAKTTAWRGII